MLDLSVARIDANERVIGERPDETIRATPEGVAMTANAAEGGNGLYGHFLVPKDLRSSSLSRRSGAAIRLPLWACTPPTAFGIIRS